LIHSYKDYKPFDFRGLSVLIETEDIPGILGKVADLIGGRATRRLERELRMASVS
jgi:hypothetical protein